MKHPGHPNKDTKHDQREDQSGQDGFAADIHDVRVARDLHACAGNLRQEAQDVVDHEDGREPFCADDGEVLGVEGADDPAEHHVDCCGDEGRRAEDEDLLEGPGADACPVCVGPGAAVVAECFA